MTQMDIYISRPHKEKQQMALEIIEYLNDVLWLSPDAIHQLCEYRVPCSDALGKHPTTQVVPMTHGEAEPGLYKVGLLGILNGLVGIRDDKWGYIAAVYEKDRLVRFELTAEKPSTDEQPARDPG